MSFFKRIFSGDYRAAVSAEAAGNLDVAAERYAMAGEKDDAVRMHLARAKRADDRTTAINALRDALHWAEDAPTLRRKVLTQLGKTMLEKARAEGIATEKDKKRVREAADLLLQAGDYLASGEALESIDDYKGAAGAYKEGGYPDRMEIALVQVDTASESKRSLRDFFADYEMHMRIGDRDAAREDLRKCIEVAEKKVEYRRLLDELESRLITGGRVVLQKRGKPSVTVCANAPLAIGRDNLCDLILRTAGISRRHAEIAVGPKNAAPRFSLRDAGSRNGTSIGGMPIAGDVPLAGTGQFSLGDHCDITFAVPDPPAVLQLQVKGGMDSGEILFATGTNERVDLSGDAEIPAIIVFDRGRPMLTPTGRASRVTLNDEIVAHGAIQLAHGDRLILDSIEVDVQ